MNLDSTIKKILYVPFNEEYLTDDENINQLLTEEIFFERCFYMPDFEKEISELLDKSDKEIQVFEVDITKEELIKKYKKNKQEKEALFNWIKSNQNEIYCIKGDAGTGKTTFLHYLDYKYRNTEIEWDIIDMNMVIDSFRILSYKLVIPRYRNVYFRTISILMKKIVDDLFVKNEGRVDIESSYVNILVIVDRYIELFEGTYPTDFISNFFKEIKSLHTVTSDRKTFVENCSKFIYEYWTSYLSKNKHNRDAAFSDFIEFYIYYNCCKKVGKRNVLAFDNLERFIGTDEIYDKQLIEFIQNVRHIQKSISLVDLHIASRFQVAIFMRNTSTRMFTPQQISEIFPHVVDLSEWFQSAKILKKKIDWYKENDIEIEQSDRLLDIINDIGHGKDGNFRGLRSKLNMLFNNDKRVIVNILEKVLENESNKYYLKQYDFFKDEKILMDKSLARFAKRVIIYRLVLNELLKDGFFFNIATKREEDNRASLAYARKVLTILYEHKLDYDDGYMKFDDIIIKISNNERDAVDKFFVKGNRQQRKNISKILFYMNYYDGRAENWLQFIDIQYNLQQTSSRIKTYEELQILIEDHHDNINIRVTSAGVAYLYFVVYSFEFFSCKSIRNAPRDCILNDGNIPPLLCAIPSKEDVLNKEIEQLLCVKIISFISKEAINCIIKIKTEKENGKKTLPFRKNAAERYMEHSNRIINSHVGYINNFIQCIKALYRVELENNSEFWEKYQRLEDKLEQIKGGYLKYK